MNKLAALVLKHKAAKYGIPENQGWMTRQQAARQLGTTERNVQDLLRDAIAAKDVQVQKFSEWDAATMRPVPITCYRVVADIPDKKAPAKKSATTSRPGSLSAELRDSILAAHNRHPGMPPGRLREYLPKRLRHACTTADVMGILAKA